MATVLITGGTGMIGKALTNELLQRQHRVMVLTRKAKPISGGIIYKEWDPEKGSIDETAIGEADYIIHLAGANVAEKRWTAKRKQEIVDSRVKSGKLLVQSIRKIPNKIKAVISASAIGWYGPDPQSSNPAPFVETDPADNAFLGRTCQLWENAIKPVQDLGKRLVTFRIGIVLSNEGGAYAEFKKPLKFGVASILGSGKQIISWIHISDLVQLFLTALENENLSGVYNAVAPHPVSNKELILAMAKHRNKFYIPVPVPSPALKIGLGEMSVEVLKSATVSSTKIEKAGYKFAYPHIQDAVHDLEKENIKH
ncbi:MAG: TIGR01777 family protein [Chitinophagaceae bacterium]|nr:MAG: TIGR01777 family protein [Chitinophagaceae bacterium]